MFKDRAIQVKMVKNTASGSAEGVDVVHLDPDQINRMIKEQVQNVAIAVGTIVVTHKVLSTLSEVAIITAKAKIR